MALTLGGVLGFLYESSFATGASLVSDELVGIFDVNGWVNLLHLLLGLAALAAASRAPREAALGLGALLVLLAVWGGAVSDRGVGTLLDALPLDSASNLARALVGIAGLLAAFTDRPPQLARLAAAAGRIRLLRRGEETRPRPRSGGPGAAAD
jgi:hypothetical protein